MRHPILSRRKLSAIHLVSSNSYAFGALDLEYHSCLTWLARQFRILHKARHANALPAVVIGPDFLDLIKMLWARAR
jgi:hypothetical protein